MFPGFSATDFKVFDIAGFKPRMEAIKTRIRPKLEAAGRDLLPDLARIGGAPAFVDDKRGYKKHCHFKLAVSRHAVRFLFEAGPEHADKKRWAAAWKRHTPQLVPVLRRAKGLAWFKNEHDEEPAAVLADMSTEDVARLGDELLRTRDGQLVLGRAIPADVAARWTPRDYARAARDTYHLLAPLYRLE